MKAIDIAPGCWTNSQVVEAFRDDCDEEKKEALEAHILSCEDCRLKAEQWREMLLRPKRV